MQIEIGDNLTLTLCVVALISAFAFGFTKGCQTVHETQENVKVKAFEAGYVEKIAEGSQNKIWTKPETK